MGFKVKDAADFQKMLVALADDLVDANIHLKLYLDLNNSVNEFIEELNNANTFWFLTFRAHSDASMIRLCRAYDSHPSSLNLRTFLQTIKANLEWFDEPQFRERMKGNAYIDSLAASARRPDEEQLGKDLVSVTDSNPLVKTLVRWRHNAIAHRTASHAIDPHEFAKRYPLSFADMQILIDQGIGILNRYGSLFHANTHASSMVGRDDYLSVLNSVRAHLKAWKAQCEEEYQRTLPDVNKDD